MNEKNHLEITRAMNSILRPMLSAFVAQKLSRHFGADNWWRQGVLDVLYEDKKRNLPLCGDYGELTDRLDIQLSLLLIDIHWQNIFSYDLPRSYLNYVKELNTTRNLWAHEPDAFDDATTIRALDTMTRISEVFDEETANELRSMWSEKLQPEKPKVIEPPEIFSTPLIGNLKPWRDVIEPHPDVAQGRYSQAEWAVNLSEAVKGTGNAEYSNPAEFFSRTYLTGGLKTLLVETLRRLTTGNGEPVIQLKTSFGGGKTHSLLALYHLFGGKIRTEQSANVREILSAAQIDFLPRVHTAVVVGTWTNPLKSTLWGEIAAQLARSTGKPELYELIRENDEKKVSPGAEVLKQIFDEAGACLILIDELVAYGWKLRLGEINDGGTVGNLMSFIQELTEAAKASPKTSVVVSIPESDAELVDDTGRLVREQVEKVFGRMEFVWTPVTVSEGYEIVRRRLFRECRDPQAREKVCGAFFAMYLNNANDFPYESRQQAYKEKLLSCYPIHPKLFDYLYDKWTSLEKFQKTRGVLRLMAKVIYQLWAHNDSNTLIMPCTMPLDAAEVQGELTKLLGDNWDAIINSEVDGSHSKPRELDSQNSRFGRLTASRKIARTIFMGTAPGSRKGVVRGVLENEILLSAIQPQEIDNIAAYNDALTKLKSNLYYLYSQDTRFWFGVNPTLRKLVDDKREQFSNDDIEYAIESWLRNWQGRGQFKAVYICPKTSADVPDEQTARLIILSPKYPYVEGQQNNAATETAKNILEYRGTVPRKWRNMLLFMAADTEKLRVLKDVVRDYLAWDAVLKEARHLNLDTLQREDAQSNLNLAKENFSMKVSQAYCKIFVPERSEDGDLNRPMQVEKIECTNGDNISAASDKFISDEKLLSSLGCEELRRLLDKFLWRGNDAIKLSQLWEYFATFYYLPRLLNVNVLLNTVRKGVASENFALAEDFQDGKYTELQFGDIACGQISLENFLIKVEVAQKQLDLDKPKPAIESGDKNYDDDSDDSAPQPLPDTEQSKLKVPKHFSMDVELDNVRYSKELKKYIDEIASYLMNLPGSETSIHVAINIFIPEGIPQDLKEIVTANCLDLKISAENFHFES